jgi:leucyl/phenylalanyl-tRNA--protein transferase
VIIDPDFLLLSYCSGYFPMADSRNGEIGWFSPNPRAIFDLHNFHIPDSLRKKLKHKPFEFKINSRFEDVIRFCADREDTWISQDIFDSYINLYRLGYAYSFESFQNNELAGGLYGVAIKGAFFGESMFHIVTDASKAALVYLVEVLKQRGYKLLDIQFMTDHLKIFGAKDLSRTEYLLKLNEALKFTCSILEE